MSKYSRFKLLHKKWGANGPSMGCGVPTMMIGITSVFVGLGMMEWLAVVAGVFILLLASYFILSMDCIAYDKDQKEIFLYKDYWFTKKGKIYPVADYTSVCIYYQIESARNNRGSLNRKQYKTFEVFLVRDKGEKLLLKEFGTIEEAKKLQFIIAEHTGLKLLKDPVRERK
jgi:hypothetical protein